jgi:hypothetical protein
MLEGFIPTTGLWWISKSGEKGLWFRKSKTEDFQAGDSENMHMEQEPAYYCMKCNRIVIDCKELVR